MRNETYRGLVEDKKVKSHLFHGLPSSQRTTLSPLPLIDLIFNSLLLKDRLYTNEQATDKVFSNKKTRLGQNQHRRAIRTRLSTIFKPNRYAYVHTVFG